ncbi:MAG: hypothetical protein WKI04_02460 [Ferruginibacter sp.]
MVVIRGGPINVWNSNFSNPHINGQFPLMMYPMIDGKPDIGKQAKPGLCILYLHSDVNRGLFSGDNFREMSASFVPCSIILKTYVRMLGKLNESLF